MITLTLIDNNENLEYFHDLYVDAFPIDERRPWHDLENRINNDERFSAYYICDTLGEYVGIITTWNLGEATYIEHFAIDSKKRSKGYGTSVLQRLTSMTPLPVVLEAELATLDENARRRIEFYERNGFKASSDFEYIQPAYTANTQPVEMTLLSHGDINPNKVKRLLYKHVYDAHL